MLPSLLYSAYDIYFMLACTSLAQWLYMSCRACSAFSLQYACSLNAMLCLSWHHTLHLWSMHCRKFTNAWVITEHL